MGVIDVGMLIRVNVDQFFGIEYEEFPAQIAQVAMWLVDHQINLLVSEAFGMYFARIPLKSRASIVHGNALKIDWPVTTYIMGNPPFIGKKEQSSAQKKELLALFDNEKGCGLLDYVSGWYIKAAKKMHNIEVLSTAFVSTNSITQGEQVAPLWSYLIKQHSVVIHFAHRTFNWSSEARGKAAVHCVVIGFTNKPPKDKKYIFDYETPDSQPIKTAATNINPYLVDAPTVFVSRKSTPLCPVSPVNKGSEATDFGHLILDEAEKNELVAKEIGAEKWIRALFGGVEFINNRKRYCLWLTDISPDELRNLPMVLERVARVRTERLKSRKKRTQEWAGKPALFSENRQPSSFYLAIPKVSSQKRYYLPIGFLEPEIIATGSLQVVPDATLYEFGIISSVMHNTWLRFTGGRMKSDYQYSNTIVYNNYPWPINATDKQKEKVEHAAQAVLDARAQFPDSTLADLYDPLTMPAELTKAHAALDKAVDKCYRPQPFTNELNRMQFLFALYEELTSKK
ncbi:MAG: class I SAM-dependent DNA methyltransferase [Candidatus Electrothrix sp. AR1]|nr:class I SAM-dependent DNA methyltransferase [Candidatus Electrothrix sp. AR1]